MEVTEHLQAILDTLPAKPGCYLMKNAAGSVIYVGKAINLRSRVRSYFHASSKPSRKVQEMVNHIVDIEWIVVDSELEALILEMNLIKKHRPHYNVRMKDDKQYPYIKVHWADDFPKVTVTRKMINDGSRYFGPYTSVWAVHQTLDVLRRIFPYLTCDRVITGQDQRACLYYDIKLCNAPCIGKVEKSTYRRMIADLCQFLNGRTDSIVSRLKLDMDAASKELDYERAATIRDQILAIETVIERQKVVSTDFLDSDVIAMARSNGEACVQVFFIRAGKIIGREYFLMEGTEEIPDPAVIAQFVKQFYNQAARVPSQVLLPHEVDEVKVIQQWLNSKSSGRRVYIKIPRRGAKRHLIQLAADNAQETLSALKTRWESDRHRQTEALAEIQSALKLAEPPSRIECYDISNTQGTAAVGSMVVFEQGIPNKGSYRRFNIRTVSGPDDYASMEEVLNRRFKRWQSDREKAGTPGYKPDPAFGFLPDLLIVDGGKGQLSRAVKVLDEFDLSDVVPVAALAKQNEEIYSPGKMRPILLPRHSQGLYLVQRIRDEAHRFAITAHRKRRTKTGLTSRLEAIPGIGPSRRKALLKEFKSVENIKEATLEDLSAVPGITKEIAIALKTQLE